MQRATTVIFGLVLAAAIALVVLRREGAAAKSAAPEEPAEGGTTEAGSAADGGRPKPGAADAGTDGAETPAEEPDAGTGELPASAPKRVGFGVVLVTYRGAERAPKNARTKAEALELAKSLAENAMKDFDEAVKKGDPGSRGDQGHVPRGVLEPALERVLFSLKAGAVHDQPIDTPKGYWIVRRND